MKNSLNKKGFTLLETLLAVGVIIILLAVSFISVRGIIKRTNQTKLDSTAQIIYVAAQNRLTEIYSAGRTAELGAGKAGVSSQTVKPSDWSGDDASFTSLCYISEGSEAADKLLPQSSLSSEVRGAKWVVEYDAASGNVYSAFFSEKSDAYYSDQETVNTKIRPSKSSRISYGATVGYYGGNIAIGGQNELGKLTCSVEIENGEELVAVIKCGVPMTNDYYKDDITLQIAVKGKTSGETVTGSATLDYFNYGSFLRTYELTLDSLKDGMSFKENYCSGENHLIPGEDVTVSVTAVSANSLVSSASASDSANSLFASYNSGDKKANIACARHLQNLDAATSGTGGAIPVMSAVQTSDINFSDNGDGKWADVYGTRLFDPIVNGSVDSFDGNGKKITGLSVDKAGDIGLFGSFSGSELKNVTLIGAAVKGGENAGALAGKITAADAEITNCKSYLVRSYFYGKSAETDKFITGSENVGGLIGRADGNVTISGSMASTVISGGGYAGGLIGGADGKTEISASYADCYISGENIGGIAGDCGDNSSFDGCYSAGFALDDAEAAGGFTPCEIESVANSYTVFSFGEVTGECYALVKDGSAERAYYANSPDTGFAGEIISGRELKELAAMTADDKLGSGFSAQDNTNNTTAYNLGEDMALGAYPYPALVGMRHYGDWAETEFNPGSLVYFEIYEDNGWGFYGANKNTLRKSGIVVRDGYALLYDSDDADAGSDVTLGWNGESITLTSASNTGVKTIAGSDYIFRPLPYGEIVNSAAQNGKFYRPLTVASGGTVNYYYFNPHFAETAIESKTEPELGGEDDDNAVIVLRSARQLYMLSKYYPQYREKTKDCTFLQELEIDYGKYKWADAGLGAMAPDTRTQDAIGYIKGGVDSSFAAKYDGGCHRIGGFSVVTNGHYYGGLFGYIASGGRVENVVFASDYDGEGTKYSINHGIMISGVGKESYIGAIAGVNEGRIENCATAGLTVNGYAYRNSKIYAGGIVGSNRGIIYNSSADSPEIKLETNNSGAEIGGFTGSNGGVIADCYALGYINVYRFDEGSVQVGGFTGGNTGSVSSSYCASALITAGLEGSGSSLVSGFAPTGTSISGCYYLNDGSYRFIDTLYYYNSAAADGVSSKNHYALQGVGISGFGTAAHSYNHTNTTAAKSDETDYPYPAVVRNAQGEFVHYGEWTFDDSHGEYGFLYWEHEEQGSNNGYHFYMVSSEGEMSDTLCTAHDDGGVVTSYGYGYYEKNAGSVTATWSNLNTGYENAAANSALSEQFNGLYKFHLFTTTDAFEPAQNSAMYLTGSGRSGTATLSSGGRQTTFTFCPFFAASIKQGTAEPGTNDADAYQVRSIDQLQFINWNQVYDNNSTWENSYTYRSFVFLQAADSTNRGTQSKKTGYCWTQSHDLEGHGKTGFTPIAAAGTTSTTSYNAVLYGWFGGAYNGQSYTIKNLAISSNCFSVGVFGVTAGANMQNIILYSEEATVIQRSTGGNNGAYALGGLIGVAYDYENSTGNTITNCAIAGYKIVDNSNRTLTLGEANVGGLIGVANVNLQNCSACVDIAANCSYYGEAKWGNFIRIGGVAGANKDKIVNCYSGGSITVGDSLLNASNLGEGTHIYIGGIAGSGFTSNYINFTNEDALDDGAPKFYNCYTYITFPAQKGNIKAISLIGSPADRYGYAPSVTIDNCYYLDTIRNIEHNSSNANFEKMLRGDLSFLGSHPTYSLDLAPMTYNQMIDGTMQGKLNAAGKVNRGAFAPVTVTENGTSQIPGKYSFPCGDSELVGENFPFPAIITQIDTFGDTVMVHYGRWHKGDGLYSDRAIATLDLLSHTGGDADTSEYQVNVRLHCYEDNAVKKITSLPVIAYGEDGSAATSKIVVCESTLNNDGSVSVSIRGIAVGAEIVCFTYNGKTTKVEVSVTATLRIKAEGTGENSVFSGDSRSWKLSVYDKNNNEIKGLSARNWVAQSDNINTANVASIAANGSGDMILTVNGYGAGSTTIRTQCVNVPLADPANTSLVSSNRLMIDLAVLRPPYAGLGSSAGAYNQFEVGETVRACKDATYTKSAPKSGTALFLYATKDFDFANWEVKDWSVSSGGEDESGLYELSFGDIKTVEGDSQYQYRDMTLLTGQKNKTVAISVTLKRGETERTLKINYLLPAEGTKFTVLYRVDGQEVGRETVEFDAAAQGYGYTETDRSFKEWQLDGVQYNFATKLRRSLALDAAWSYNTVTLKDGGSTLGSVYAGNTGFYSDTALTKKLTAVPIPTNGSFTFAGYVTANGTPFAAADGTISILAGDIKGDIAVSAVWRIRLTLSSAKSDDHQTQSFTITNGSAALAGYTAPSRAGWTLDSWYSGEGGSGVKVLNANGTLVNNATGFIADGKWALTSETTLYAAWQRQIKLVNNANNTEQDCTITDGGSTIGSDYTQPARAGWTFDGWYSGEGGSGVKVINADRTLVSSAPGYVTGGKWSITGDATLYASWTCKLTLSATGANPWTQTLDVTDGSSTLDGYTEPTRTGCTLGGWYSAQNGGGVKILNADGTIAADVTGYTSDGKWKLSGDTTLYASWQYSLTLSAAKSDRPTQNFAIINGSDSLGGYATPVRTGWTLTGWYSAQYGGTRVLYANGTLVNNATGYVTDGEWALTGETTLYARWQRTLTLRANSANNASLKTQTFTITDGGNTLGSGYTAPARTNWTFDGWYSATNNSGVKVLNADGSLVAGADGYTDASGRWELDGTPTLYARWQRSSFNLQTTSGLENGGEYLIVSSNSAGSAYALQCTGNGSWNGNSRYQRCEVEIESDVGFGITIDTNDDSLIWTADGGTFENNEYNAYLYRNNSNLRLVNSSYSASAWTYGGSTLVNSNRYLYYNGSNFALRNNSVQNVYLYKLQEVISYD